MKVETYSTLKSNICIKTQFENVLTSYIKSVILTKRLVMLPQDWDRNGLLCIYEMASCDEYDYWLFIGKTRYEQYLTLWYSSNKYLYIN